MKNTIKGIDIRSSVLVEKVVAGIVSKNT